MSIARRLIAPIGAGVLALVGALGAVAPAQAMAVSPAAQADSSTAAAPSVHFTAAGDIGSSTNAAGVLSGMGSVAPDFDLALGDLSYGVAGAEQSWCDFVRSEIGPTTPFELISGNHESNGENGYIDNFARCLPNGLTGLVGTYGKEWYVDVPASAPVVRIILISPNLSFGGATWQYTKGSAHYNWTANAIDSAHAANIPWVVVGMHEPCLAMTAANCSSGPDLMNLLVAKKVDLVLSGHVHMYARTKQLADAASCPQIVPNTASASCIADADNSMVQGGTVFATVGTGGEDQETPNPQDPEAPYFAKWSASKAWGFLDVTVDDNELTATFDRTSGAALSDSFTIYRGGSTNIAPTAAFSSSCSGLGCSFDGTGSQDSDGSVASYAWSFGDGGTGSGASPSHTYASAGTFTVTLTVTDNDGATGSVSRLVTTTGSGQTGTIAFVGATHGQTGAVKTEGVTVPAAAVAGQTMLLFFTRNSDATWSAPTGLTGWTQLGTGAEGSTVSTVWERPVAAGDAGKTVHFTSPTYQKGALVLAVYSGVGAGAPVVARAGDSFTSVHISPTLDAPAGSRVVTLWADKSESTTSWTAPATVTVRDTDLGTGRGRFTSLLTDSGVAVTGGSYGGLTATTNATSTHAQTWAIALPAA